MRKVPFTLALLVSLGLMAAYLSLPLSARPIPEDGTVGEIAPSSTPSATPPATMTEPTAIPGNAAANSLAAVATRTVEPAAGENSTNAPGSGNVIGAEHPSIAYTGRFDLATAGVARFDWPATTIEATFTGTSITVLLEPADNHFNVVLDGVQSQLLPGDSRYRFRGDPALAQHTIRLTKRTEAYAGTAVFRGFVLEPGERLLGPPPAATRRIEFLGDSITAGYGAGGASAACDFSRETQDVQLTFAEVTAAAFGADYSVIAMSGLGAVRNYQQDAPTSAEPLSAFYPRTLALAPESAWSFAEWPVDAVVINLGTNDFSTTPWPSEATFVDGYVKMMAEVRTHYPGAHIFAMAGPLLFGPAESYIRAAVTRMQETDERVHFVPIAADLGPAQMGCDFHPNAAGHRRIAEQLIPAMAAQMGW